MAATTDAIDALRRLSSTVNGEPVQLDLPAGDYVTLLDVLRDVLGITSPKNSCQPQAQCGCCTVLMDGKAVLSCALSPEKAEGKAITTLEGLDDEHRKQISESFVRCGGVQCGFCIPGMAMRAVGLCEKSINPSREEIAGALDISVRTVEFHKYQMMETLALHNSTELTHFAIKHGIVTI